LHSARLENCLYHRIVDGREAVTFLRRIKEALEAPARMLLEI